MCFAERSVMPGLIEADMVEETYSEDERMRVKWIVELREPCCGSNNFWGGFLRLACASVEVLGISQKVHFA